MKPSLKQHKPGIYVYILILFSSLLFLFLLLVSVTFQISQLYSVLKLNDIFCSFCTRGILIFSSLFLAVSSYCSSLTDLRVFSSLSKWNLIPVTFLIGQNGHQKEILEFCWFGEAINKKEDSQTGDTYNSKLTFL